ncbi:MAG: hypothetical protein KY397_05695 [Gemmatimonadetes bacterium]|nr:hypothetical protein [Gemmatimonadota bacterium]
MKIIGSHHLVTALAVAALALVGCERDADTGEAEDPVAEENPSAGDVGDEDGDTTSLRAEAREAGEEIEEAAREGIEAVGKGTEELGEEIQESVEKEDEEPREP